MAERKRPSVKRALDDALRVVDTERCDGAALALAKRYAGHIDENPGDLGKFGPLLLDSLRDLRMTPKARSAVVKEGGSSDSGERSTRDELRGRRDRRQNGAAAVDSSAT